MESRGMGGADDSQFLGNCIVRLEKNDVNDCNEDCRKKAGDWFKRDSICWRLLNRLMHVCSRRAVGSNTQRWKEHGKKVTRHKSCDRLLALPQCVPSVPTMSRNTLQFEDNARGPLRQGRVPRVCLKHNPSGVEGSCGLP